MLVNEYYQVIDAKKSLLQILDFNDYKIYPISYSLFHQKTLKLICQLSKLYNFNAIYYYNVIFEDAELDLPSRELVFNIEFDQKCEPKLDEFIDVLNIKGPPVFFPYDKILIPSTKSLEFFFADIESVSLCFFMIKKNMKLVNIMNSDFCPILDKVTAIEYVSRLMIDAQLKANIINKCSFFK